jgi:hypothetical protein
MVQLSKFARAFFRSPFGRGIQQAAVVLAGFAILAFSGVVDCGPDDGTLVGAIPADVVVAVRISPAGPVKVSFTETIVLTVMAINLSGSPVPNSQSGILLTNPGDRFVILVEDEPDPDNAVMRFTIRPKGELGDVPVEATVTNKNGVVIRSLPVTIGFTHTVARLVFDPAGPFDMLNGQTAFITVRALDAGENPVPGAERFIGVRNSTTSEPILAGNAIETIGPGTIRFPLNASPSATGEARIEASIGNPLILSTLVARILTAPTGSVIASTPNAQAVPGNDIILRALVRDAAGNSFPGGEPFVQATSSNTAVATIQGRSEGAANGIVEFTVRGVTAGNAEIRFTYPGAPNAVTNLTVVNAPPGRVVSVQSGAQMQAGTTIVLTARVRDRVTNALVPGSDPFITARAANQGIATVLGKDEGIPGDGEVTFTIRGDSPGVAIILFSYPGSDDDTTSLTVNP